MTREHGPSSGSDCGTETETGQIFAYVHKVKPQTRVAIALNFAAAGTISTLSEAAHNL